MQGMQHTTLMTASGGGEEYNQGDKKPSKRSTSVGGVNKCGHTGGVNRCARACDAGRRPEEKGQKTDLRRKDELVRGPGGGGVFKPMEIVQHGSAWAAQGVPLLPSSVPHPTCLHQIERR